MKQFRHCNDLYQHTHLRQLFQILNTLEKNIKARLQYSWQTIDIRINLVTYVNYK